MAKVGELMLAGGRWDGRQLVPADRVRTITTQVPPGGPASALQDSFMAWGFFGQWILVMPHSGLVVVEKYDATAPLSSHTPTVPITTFMNEAAGIADAGC
ncbi:MAG: hypothetical protein JO224_09130 [Pelomonas sp.]|nr:hypothetical protein [Roseateles sp.]